MTKIVFGIIHEREEQFIDLSSRRCKVLATPFTLQLMGRTEVLRDQARVACESKATLVKLNALSAYVIIDKIFFSYNSQALQKEHADYDVIGVINFENIVDMQLRVASSPRTTASARLRVHSSHEHQALYGAGRQAPRRG